MKQLSKLKLHDLSRVEMEKRELSLIKGGDSCTCCCILPCNCPCLYEGTKSDPTDSYYGGSSSSANSSANDGGGDVTDSISKEDKY
jgi:natural product precursor